MSGSRAQDWLSRGGYFEWDPGGDGAEPVRIFHIEAGADDAPPLLLVHGFPTSSIDWYETIDRLSEQHRVCALDFPGYGFSDKPKGWGYSLQRDARLLSHYLSDVVRAEKPIVVSHDRGDSIALILAAGPEDGTAHDIAHLVLMNGNIFLPLSNLTAAQRVMLDEATAAEMLDNATPEMLAMGMGASTFWPPRGADDPAVGALAETFAHENGLSVIHETIQYLVERSEDEGAWLGALAASDVPTTVIWGLNDTVSPPRVPSWVWNQHLMMKPGDNSLYFISDAGHYLQNDRPDAVVDTILHALGDNAEAEPGAIGPDPGSPVLVDRSRERLPEAADVLRAPAG